MNQTSGPSAEIPVEGLGPAGIKGELHVLAILQNEQRQDEDRLYDQTERSFKVSGQLSKNPPAAGVIKGDFGVNDGGSYLIAPDHALFSRVRCAEGQFEIKKNNQGEKSLVEFDCVAANTASAKQKFQTAVLPFLDYLSFVVNCPVFVAVIRVEDPKNDHTSIEYVSPYRTATVNPHESRLFIELAPVYAMYREAKNSSSDFYRFLCYYKILEGLLGALRAKVFARARSQHIELPRERELVPASEHISQKYAAHIGSSIKSFFDDVLTPNFRNAVAHFITNDGAVLNMSSPEHIESYAELFYVLELCVRSVIESHERLLANLESATLAK